MDYTEVRTRLVPVPPGPVNTTVPNLFWLPGTRYYLLLFYYFWLPGTRYYYYCRTEFISGYPVPGIFSGTRYYYYLLLLLLIN